MKRFLGILGALAFTFPPSVDRAFAQPASPLIRLFEQRCTSCHRNAGVELAPDAERAPDVATLQTMTPEAIYRALAAGAMQAHAKDLTDETKRAIAEYLGGRKIRGEEAADARRMPNHCPQAPPLGNLSSMPAWNGWGGDVTNARFQSAQAAGLSADRIPRLELKWAFGFPGATSVYGQPTVAAGRVFIGVDTGYVYALDATTGCVHWSFQAQAGVRNAISVGLVKGHGAATHAVYFGDLRANVYAVNAATGEPLWKVNVDAHPLAVITGAPTLHQDRLYVPVASREEAAGGGLTYPCCTFRGSIVALDANTGRQVWRAYIIPEVPKPTRKNSKGVQLWAPAGGGVWSSPTIDVKRRAVYVATGDAYTHPAPNTTDAVIAFDLETGKIRWVVQDTANDAWLVGCDTESRTENCPKDVGPDYDFGSSAILRTLPDGRTVLVAGQKSGEVYAHDAGREGAVVWKATLVQKLARGEITFGGAADERAAYFGLRSGGIAAIDLRTGQRKWFAPLPPEDPRSPRRGQTAALTAIPGVVFSGGWDGFLRAFASDDGRLLWAYDTNREFATVNGVAAKGGSMGAPGPTVAGGVLFAGSGYVGLQNGAPGNVLLAFGVP